MEFAELTDDTDARAQGQNLLGILSRSQGDLDISRRHLERSLALAETLDDPSQRVAALNNLALALKALGGI